MRNRNVHVQLWLNRKEADALAHGAKKCGLTQSAYLRHLITGFVPKELPPPDYHAMMRQLYGLTNNLNQIARYFNMGGLQSKAMREEINSCVVEIMILRKRVLEMAGDFHGGSETPIE